MATDAQIAANYANAQHSTGPITEEGKARSSANSLRHGFNSQTVILAGEDTGQYEDLLFDLQDAFPIQGHLILERAVREMANAEWRLRRVRLHLELTINAKIADLQSENPSASPLRLQSQALDQLVNESRMFKMLLRYETRFENLYHRAERDWTAYNKQLHQHRQQNEDPLNVSELLPESLIRQIESARNKKASSENWVRSAPPGSTPRNNACPCGSGKKYKRCCGQNAPPVLDRGL